MISSIRQQFPLLQNFPELAYLDNAATTQKPQVVIDALVEFYETYNANVHRGLYPLSEQATDLYEEARKTIARFINAQPEEIIFTSGTTGGVNAIARMIDVSNMFEYPNILLSDMEHHANILPWQRLQPKHMGYLRMGEDYTLHTTDKDFSFTYDILSLSKQSNVTGTIIELGELIPHIQTHADTLVVLDVAQSIAHEPIDVKALNVDFLTFSGHKMYGPMGIGVIYGKKELLEQLEPFDVGGGMIREVTRDNATWAPLPEKFEAGTPPVAQAHALAVAARWIENIGFKKIHRHEKELREYAYDQLSKIDGLTLYHPGLDLVAGAILSFDIEGTHAHDIAQYLGDQNIAVRAGHHCTQILHREIFTSPATTRASFAVYNTLEEVDRLVEKVREAVKVYRK